MNKSLVLASLVAAVALAVHFWVDSTDAAPAVVLLVRLAAVAVPIAWAVLTVVGGRVIYREPQRP